MIRTFLFIAALVIGLGAATFSRFGGLLFYLWFTFFRPQEWVWIDVEPYRFSLVAGLALVVPCLATGVFPDIRHPLARGVVAFVLTAALSHAYAVNGPVSFYWLTHLVEVAAVSLLAITLCTSQRRIMLATAVVAGSLGFHGAKFGVGFLLRGGARFVAGIGGSFSSNNEFGLAVARVIPLLAASGLVQRRVMVKGPWLAAAGLSCLAVVATYSRGASLALAAGLVAYVLLQRRRWLFVSLSALVAPLILLVTPVPADYLQRLLTVRTYQQIEDESALSRLYFWQLAIVMVRDNPFGVGLRNFEYNYDKYDSTGGLYGEGRAVHSSHFQALAETGYLGFSIWLWLNGYAIWTGLKIRRRALKLRPAHPAWSFHFHFANGLVASLIAFLIGGSFGAAMLNELNWMSFALVAALDNLSLVELGSPPPAGTVSGVKAG